MDITRFVALSLAGFKMLVPVRALVIHPGAARLPVTILAGIIIMQGHFKIWLKNIYGLVRKTIFLKPNQDIAIFIFKAHRVSPSPSKVAQ